MAHQSKKIEELSSRNSELLSVISNLEEEIGKLRVELSEKGEAEGKAMTEVILAKIKEHGIHQAVNELIISGSSLEDLTKKEQ